MARLNTPTPPIFTHEGAKAQHITAEQQLRRSVLACMLWEKEFYEDGQTIADRIVNTVPSVKPEVVAALAIDARSKFKLRHVPLLLVATMAKLPTHRHLVKDTLATVIQRPDELTEFLAIYWRNGKCPLSAQVKRGLAEAFTKFDLYTLAKYNRDNAIKLRDVLFLCHAKPKDNVQAATWKQLVDNTLPVPDTWEVALSTGADKKQTWERLLSEGRLGALALLRNLRNMQAVDVSEQIVRDGLRRMKTDRVLPFRFISAARYAPRLEPELEEAMFRCLEGQPKLTGRTVLLVDVSGSMDQTLSAKSEMLRIDAACGLAVLARELCEQVIVLTFSNNVVEVPLRRGFALRDAVVRSQPHQGTYLGQAVQLVNENVKYDRLVVFTDEQSHSPVPAPSGRGYMVNVASAKNGVGYGPWRHIDGFSEAVFDYIREVDNPVSFL